MPGSMACKDITAEASQWVAVSRSDDITADERAAMDAWLREDACHAEAFAKVERIAIDAASLKSLAALEPRPTGNRRRSWMEHRPWARLTSTPRRLALGGAVAASVAVAALLPLGLVARADLDVTTAVGETRLVILADRTRVTLGPKSHLRAYFEADERHVELASGEAFFEVTHDASRPFIVEAGDTRVRVLGTKFDVNHNPERVSVNVLEGTVQVRETAPLFTPSAVRILHAGQRVETKASLALLGRSSAASVVTSDIPAGDWRVGRLTYANSRLGDVVADLNRYYAPGIRIADPALADARIATTFMPDEIETFFTNLPVILPVNVSRGENGEVTIAEQSGRL
jgi:transmembrane sensor